VKSCTELKRLTTERWWHSGKSLPWTHYVFQIGSKKLIYLLWKPQLFTTKANLIKTKLYFSIKSDYKNFQFSRVSTGPMLLRHTKPYLLTLDWVPNVFCFPISTKASILTNSLTYIFNCIDSCFSSRCIFLPDRRPKTSSCSTPSHILRSFQQVILSWSTLCSLHGICFLLTRTIRRSQAPNITKSSIGCLFTRTKNRIQPPFRVVSSTLNLLYSSDLAIFSSIKTTPSTGCLLIRTESIIQASFPAVCCLDPALYL